MVLGSQPSRVEIYSVPPWPSLAASMAAYRLRSFSESESWNICIECSISGLYVMSGRPWRGLDRPGYGYTAGIADREVIESAILNPADLGGLDRLAVQARRRGLGIMLGRRPHLP